MVLLCLRIGNKLLLLLLLVLVPVLVCFAPWRPAATADAVAFLGVFALWKLGAAAFGFSLCGVYPGVITASDSNSARFGSHQIPSFQVAYDQTWQKTKLEYWIGKLLELRLSLLGRAKQQ